MNWLDTETKAILQREDESRIAPSKVAEFALVLGAGGVDRERQVRAVCRINDCSKAEAIALLAQPSPVVINADLTQEEASLGQFELICCEAISAVVRSEVACEADREYLKTLLAEISRSPEFKITTVQIDSVPATPAGRRFVDQFLGMDLAEFKESKFPYRFRMPAKKARIMMHWALRVEAKVRYGAN